MNEVGAHYYNRPFPIEGMFKSGVNSLGGMNECITLFSFLFGKFNGGGGARMGDFVNRSPISL